MADLVAEMPHAGTLGALISMVKPGGWVIVGEPYWQREPATDYLEALGCAREDFGSHVSHAEAGEQRGLELVQRSTLAPIQMILT